VFLTKKPLSELSAALSTAKTVGRSRRDRRRIA